MPPGQSLFESILVFENYPVEASLKEQRSSLQIHDVRHFGKTNYPLTVVIAPGDDLDVRFVYDPTLIDKADVQALLVHFIQILNHMLLDPEQVLSSVKMLTPEDEHRLYLFSIAHWDAANLVESKVGHLSVPMVASNTTVVKLFNDQCIINPAAVALVEDRKVLTYQELNQKADQLASGLLMMGITPEELVGISIERSIEMIVAILAVLKAGGAYVPLDPTYPSERLSFMVQDAGIKILLTKTHLVDGLSQVLGDIQSQGSGKTLQVICLDEDWDSIIAAVPDSISLPVIDPDQAAYVIYTSGSTGTPKGVVITHAALANHDCRI